MINQEVTQTLNTGHSSHVPHVLQPKAYDMRNGNDTGDVTHTLQAKNSGGYSLNTQPVITAYNVTFCDSNGRRQDRPNGGLYVNETDKANTLSTSSSGDNTTIVEGLTLRRLTPVECERLQGFPDNHTEGQSDTQRYKQMGNAVAVPVITWIGKRILETEKKYGKGS